MSYTTLRKKEIDTDIGGDEDNQAVNKDSDHFETEPEDLEVGIGIYNLRKVFGGLVVVKDFSLNMYKGQVGMDFWILFIDSLSLSLAVFPFILLFYFVLSYFFNVCSRLSILSFHHFLSHMKILWIYVFIHFCEIL